MKERDAIFLLMGIIIGLIVGPIAIYIGGLP